LSETRLDLKPEPAAGEKSPLDEDFDAIEALERSWRAEQDAVNEGPFDRGVCTINEKVGGAHGLPETNEWGSSKTIIRGAIPVRKRFRDTLLRRGLGEFE
jgi:hypothetical protein